MNLFQNNFGFGYKTDRYISFFGNIHGEVAQLQSEFQNLKFIRVKQTHSDIVVMATEQLIEADAHYTDQKKLALLIATADCMPIMIYCEQTHRCAAVHAGWRGVANKITEKTLQRLIATGSTQKNFKIFVGPSILQNSFEIDADVFFQLKQSQYGLDDSDYSLFQNNKYYVDLTKIVLSQMNTATNGLAEVTFCNIDTKTNLDFYSYRRGKQTKERNLSFICSLI